MVQRSHPLPVCHIRVHVTSQQLPQDLGVPLRRGEVDGGHPRAVLVGDVRVHPGVEHRAQQGGVSGPRRLEHRPRPPPPRRGEVLLRGPRRRLRGAELLLLLLLRHAQELADAPPDLRADSPEANVDLPAASGLVVREHLVAAEEPPARQAAVVALEVLVRVADKVPPCAWGPIVGLHLGLRLVVAAVAQAPEAERPPAARAQAPDRVAAAVGVDREGRAAGRAPQHAQLLQLRGEPAHRLLRPLPLARTAPGRSRLAAVR
mmetsp:Transcript_26894/g.84410  ORF Transcript_26894/g.84410 Transcript_26894/m.84410 type:complete len:261 (-) Transcript_26894:346-1128(-)